MILPCSAVLIGLSGAARADRPLRPVGERQETYRSRTTTTGTESLTLPAGVTLTVIGISAKAQAAVPSEKKPGALPVTSLFPLTTEDRSRVAKNRKLNINSLSLNL